jgi:small subunit ribosomal protein S1
MRARDKVRAKELPAHELLNTIESVFGSGDEHVVQLDAAYEQTVSEFAPNKVVKGKIVDIRNDEVVVDIGYKSEGVISLGEFADATEFDVGDIIEVFLESVDQSGGGIVLSKRRADRIRGWERIVQSQKEGDTVRGRVLKKIKGGLLVDIGVPAFLPASQVAIRRANDIGEFIGKDIEARIIKIDEPRMNIVVSRRKLIE